MAPSFRESKTPHFFKVILKDDNDLHHLNLCIPKKFVRKHERDLADTVSLEVAGGDTWDVKLFKEDGEFLLHDGWEDFMRHYGVKHGHFLIFRYEGGSKFHVVICDITACEIDYPPKPTAQPHHRDTVVQEPKICAKLRPPVEARKNLVMGSSHLATMAPTCPAKRRRAFDRARSSESGYWPVPLARDSSKCKEPPFFQVVIQPSALTHSINIPACFMKDHIEQKAGRAMRVDLDATLKVMKKSWLVTITKVAREYNRYRIVKGWPRFAMENELQRGDICLFTLVNMDWVFLVSITRKGQD